MADLQRTVYSHSRHPVAEGRAQDRVSSSAKDRRSANCATPPTSVLLIVQTRACVCVCSELVKISWQEHLMRTVSRHADRLTECLSVVKTADIRHADRLSECLSVVKTADIRQVPTMFAGEQSQTLAVQLVCMLHCY